MKADFIIIGAGSAGCTLANRLSENNKYSVCVLEAGHGDNSMLVNTPLAFAAFMFLKKFNWSFNAKKHADIRDNTPLFVPRGKGIGGSSSINAMLYIRGQKQDYDHWESLGNTGWSYNDLLPYFIKSETNERGVSEYHGDNGPLHVSDRPIHYEISKRFLKAGEQLGFKMNDDFNSADQEGFGLYQCTIKNGQRCGAARAYLKPAMQRNNVIIETHAKVKRIIIENGQAVGVEYTQNGKNHIVHADKEVILSAGAIQSPQVLMLSGIGPQDQLQQFGIECVKDLPGVGKNLQEHVDSCVLVKSKKRDGVTTSILGLLGMIPSVFNYITKKQGKLANSILEAGAFLKSSPEYDRPDLQYHMLPLLYDDNGRDFSLLRQHGYSCHVCILRPESTGTVTLKSNNYEDDPEIDFNFFSDPKGEDKKLFIEGVKMLRTILAAPSFDDYRSTELAPGDENQSDEDIFIAAKKRLGTVYHPVGTCKMGNDSLAVVDTNLKVHGIENLRVVDASIMPTLISGNTNAPTIAIAEKAADLILQSV